MEIKDRKISEISPYPKNAKKHPKRQLTQIANSIAEFGFNQPIVVDNESVIIVGHGRYYAAMSLAMENVPVLELDITEEQAKTYRLADNKLNESSWDINLVISELKSISLKMVDLTGFDSNLILDTKEDRPNINTINPKSVDGDIYILGNHKLICGDSTKPETYKKLLGDERARLIFTDPPYSIDYHSVDKKSASKGEKKGGNYSYNSEKFGGTGGRIFNDNKTPTEALAFYKEVLKQLYDFSSDDATIYWWYATRLTDINMQALREQKWHFSQIIMWLKNSLIFSPGQLFHRIYEPCLVAWKENGVAHYQNFAFSKYTELWTLDKKTFNEHLDVWYEKRDNTNKYIHPTQKPVRLAERALKRSSDKSDIVLDAFGGSGSTLISCEQLGRKCRMIELDPKYVDAIVTRYLQFTEKTHVIKNGVEVLW